MLSRAILGKRRIYYWPQIGADRRTERLAQIKSGDGVSVLVKRGGEELKIDVTLERRNAQSRSQLQ
jgi:hypothetical protein